MLLHFLRTVPGAARERALALLRTPRQQKTAEEVEWLHQAMRERGSLRARPGVSRCKYSERALEVDARGMPIWQENEDRRFLREMLRYVIDRIK